MSVGWGRGGPSLGEDLREELWEKGGKGNRHRGGGRRDRVGKKESSLWVCKCYHGNGGLWPANGDGGRSNEFFPSSSSLKSAI